MAPVSSWPFHQGDPEWDLPGEVARKRQGRCFFPACPPRWSTAIAGVPSAPRRRSTTVAPRGKPEGREFPRKKSSPGTVKSHRARTQWAREPRSAPPNSPDEGSSQASSSPWREFPWRHAAGHHEEEGEGRGAQALVPQFIRRRQGNAPLRGTSSGPSSLFSGLIGRSSSSPPGAGRKSGPRRSSHDPPPSGKGRPPCPVCRESRGPGCPWPGCRPRRTGAAIPHRTPASQGRRQLPRCRRMSSPRNTIPGGRMTHPHPAEATPSGIPSSPAPPGRPVHVEDGNDGKFKPLRCGPS